MTLHSNRPESLAVRRAPYPGKWRGPRLRRLVCPGLPMWLLRAMYLTHLLILASAAWSATVTMEATVTAYSPSVEGGGAGTGRTSIGVRTDAQPYGVAADPRLIPYGAWVSVPGYREDESRGGPWWPVDDTGAAMRRAADRGVLHIDLRMRNPWAARQWGIRVLTVTIYIPEAP